MKLKLHHLNLCTNNVAAMDEFYTKVLDMHSEASRNATRDTSQGYSGKVAFVTDGQSEVHLAERDLKIGFKMFRRNAPQLLGAHAWRETSREFFAVDQPVWLRVGADQRGGQKPLHVSSPIFAHVSATCRGFHALSGVASLC